MRRSDLQAAEPTPRDNWIEHSTEPRSPGDVDYLTWAPREQWDGSGCPTCAGKGWIRVRRATVPPTVVISRCIQCDPGQGHRKLKPIPNLHYHGSRNLSEREIGDVLREIRDAMEPQLLPGLLAAILMNRKVRPERVRALIGKRFGRTPSDDELLGLTTKAIDEIETRLEARLGFLPKYQVRWIGLV